MILTVSPPSLRGSPRALLALACVAVLAACSSDDATDDGTTSSGVGASPPDSGGNGTSSPTVPDEGSFALRLAEPGETLREGAGEVTLDVTIVRATDHDLPVTLAAAEEGVDDDGLVWRFADTVLEADESTTSLSVSLPIGPLPRLPETRTLRIVATDPSGTRLNGEVAVPTVPTELPDVYLLAGQSNMVGASRAGARQAQAGELDAPDERIFQLNVTINDPARFPNPASFTDVDSIVPPGARIITALDPLHDTLNAGDPDKSGTTIGLGLSFAKAALADTTADIVLVPSAWSDSGFCRRESLQLPAGMGWNARAPESEAFAGTLLHDRAIARTNLAIEETDGILRGILWHQGEADSDSAECAAAYEENLRAMVASLRTNIAVDARGASARGAQADIPFIVGTMSKGTDERAQAFAPFGAIKSIVDAVHRDVASVVPLATFVNADDLVPPAYPCGFGDCIHFGAEALRELGVRYYAALRSLFDGT